MNATSWLPLISSIVGLIGAVVVVSLTIRHNARTTRANLFSSYRLKWMDLFREELAELLILGERLYEPSLQENATDPKVAADLRASGKRLIILLGLEDDLRKCFGALVRSFAASPTAELSQLLEVEAQKVFRDAWDRGRADTGKPSASERPPRHSLGPRGRTGVEGNAASNSRLGDEGSGADG